MSLRCSQVGLVALVLGLSLAASACATLSPEVQFKEAAAALHYTDYSTALRRLRPLAKQGYAPAQWLLGTMYFAGEGVPQDFFEATTWYRKAAEQGLDAGQYYLGNMLYADQDYVQAHMWFSLAAARSPEEHRELREMAITKRDEVAAKMTAAQIAEAERLAREWKPK